MLTDLSCISCTILYGLRVEEEGKKRENPIICEERQGEMDGSSGSSAGKSVGDLCCCDNYFSPCITYSPSISASSFLSSLISLLPLFPQMHQ